MNIVIPMAGRGQRFVDAGFTAPKPLIDVGGRPMYSWAVDSLPLELATRLIFVCLREHLESLELERDIRARYGRHTVEIRALDDVTEGQACTVLLACEAIDESLPLLVYNADTMCRPGLERTLTSLPPSVDGLIGVFEAVGDHWSFARADADGRVLETAEKVRISSLATTGLYFFSRGRDFVLHARRMIAGNERVNSEFFVAPVYNRMIASGADIRVVHAMDVHVLGTPNELAAFIASGFGEGRRGRRG